jgi:molybdopterin molybdotransferase
LPANVVRIPFEEAVSRLTACLKVRKPEEVPVTKALGCSLSGDVVAGWHLPRFDVSHMDGYAVRSADLAGASKESPVLLHVGGLSRPDGLGPVALAVGTCVRVLTGGRVPSGSDAVVAQEAVQRVGDDVTFIETVDVGSHIHGAGSDVREGTLLFRKGHILNARDIAFLLSFGLPSVTVAKRLRVGILASGSELVEGVGGPVEGKIIESNRMVLTEVLMASGFLVNDLGLSKDDADEIAARLKGGLGSCDAILTTGGSSVSEADLVPDALRQLGATEVFHGLLLRPSRTLGAFLLGEVPVFLLSGLIQGGVSAFFNMVYPAFRYMEGHGWDLLPGVKAVLTRGLDRREGDRFRLVTWVRLASDQGMLKAEPMKAASTTRFVLTKVNGFIVGEPGQAFDAGDMVEVRLPRGFGLEDSLGGQ